MYLGRICGDIVEDVDENEEEGDEESHSTRDNVGGYQKRDPGNNLKHISNDEDVTKHDQ